MTVVRIFKGLNLRRLYSTFPGGIPGVGLLLLRAAIGAKLIIHALAWMNHPEDFNLKVLSIGPIILIAGCSFVFGFLTPLAGALVALTGMLSLVSRQLPDPFFFTRWTADTIAMATAISLLGPGAFSLDAHWFGRRRIIFPPQTRRQSDTSITK
jgi:hypothetical protein